MHIVCLYPLHSLYVCDVGPSTREWVASQLFVTEENKLFFSQ